MFANIDWNPSKRELRKFGLTLLIALPIFGVALCHLKFKWETLTPLYACSGAGIFVAFCAFFLPPVGLLLYKLWMGLAFVLSVVVSPIFMGAIYYLVFTPMGFALRLAGKDSMQRRKPKNGSYWRPVKHHTAPRSYERQF
jgi:hypothetical protein